MPLIVLESDQPRDHQEGLGGLVLLTW